MKKRVKAILSSIALFSIELILAWIIFVFSFFVFLFVSNEIFYNKQEEFDYKFFAWIDEITTEGFTSFMKFMTFFASREFIFVAAVLVFFYFLFIKRHKWYSLKIPVVALGSISLNILMKSLFDRPRPIFPHLVEASGFSFPSGHAMISFSFYGLLIYLIWREVEAKWLKYSLTAFLLLIIHLIGFSRIYLKVHFASDVLAGFALGIIWLILSIFILRKVETFSARNIKPIVKN